MAEPAYLTKAIEAAARGGCQFEVGVDFDALPDEAKRRWERLALAFLTPALPLILDEHERQLRERLARLRLFSEGDER